MTDDIALLLDRYLAGDHAPLEGAALREQLRASGISPEVLDAARRHFDEAAEADSVSKTALDAERTRLLERVQAQQAITIAPVKTPRAYGLWRGMVMMGLGLAGVIALFSLRHRTYTSTPSQHQYTTRIGQRATLILADGSRVTLAPESQLIIADDFGSHTRTVSLNGEAYFEVAKAQGAPFIVQAGMVHTRVLGTTFDVRHYATDADVRVTVLTGKISAGAKYVPVLLTAGTIGHLTDSTVTTDTPRDVRGYAEWTHGQLVFDNAPVPVMLATISHWYGYEFRLADSTFATEHITAEFRADAPQEAMALLKHVLRVTMTFETGPSGIPVVTLHPRHDSEFTPTRTHEPVWSSHPLEAGK